jgi:hypothetical protein
MWKKTAALFLLLALAGGTFAQQPAPLARCIDQVRGQSFIVLQNLYTFQEGFPANNGIAMRDPSGQTLLRLPAVSPMQQAFFLTWQNQLIELNLYTPGPVVIGGCQFFAPAPQQQKVNLPNYAYTQGQGVITQNALLPVPAPFYAQSAGISPPVNSNPQVAGQCLNQSGNDKSKFMDCMVPRMMSQQQVAAYNCMRNNSTDRVSLSTCIARQMMGPNEQRALDQATQCYRQHGNNFDKYPLCMANQNFDPKTAAAVNCVRQQAQQANASAWSVAGCVAGGVLNLNPELTVAMECAMSSGGEPMTFAGCTGGRLTVMELNKCFTIGVGGNGCFGDNNEIVKGLRAVGVDLGQIMGPNGFVIQNWNNAVSDFQKGPGPNNEVRKAINTVNNDLRNGMGKNNDVRRALTNIGLGGLF